MNVISVSILFSVLWLGTYCYDDDEELPTIEISTGFLQAGYRELSHIGVTYTAFEGIPYAKPPVGELRFQAPEEPYNWTGIWKANTKYYCIPFVQVQNHQRMPVGEDCLYLNVYVPNTNPSGEDNFDVIVHFHGTGFTVGDPHATSGPKYLMDEEHMIYVSLNYRLGPLGFLSTEDRILPGNNGLKDQVMALKWIQKNIKYFGGNPDSVTITGTSAGGASVHYHYLSPLSKGLFHRGYSGSGTVLDPWALQDSPLVKAKQLAVILGCNPITSQDILNCVMQRSSQAILVATQKFLINGMPFSPFGPVIEPTHDNAFLQHHPYKQLKNGPVHDLPWIVVINKDEGLFPAAIYHKHMKNIDNDWETFAPHLFDYNYTVSHNKLNDVTRKIKRYYFGDKSVSFKKLIKACTDRHFFRGAEKAAKLQQKVNKSPVYMLMFAYEGDHSYSALFGVPIDDRGAAHGDDSLYYLSSNIVRTFNKSDEKIKDIMVKMISSFSRNNVPTVEGVEWKPLKDEKLTYLYLNDFNGMKMQEGDDIGSHEFWKTLGIKENEESFPSTKDEL